MNDNTVPITVTFRHIAPTEALRTHAEKKLDGVATKVPGATDIHVVLSAAPPHHHRQLAEITVHGAHVLTAREETNDMYAAIDLAVTKLESQIRRLKGKIVGGPRRGSTGNRRNGPSSATA